MNSGISIKGGVKISLVSPNGKRTSFGKGHNTITKRMAEGVARFLAGNFFDKSNYQSSETYLPLYVGIGTGEVIDLPYTAFTIADLVNPIYQRVDSNTVVPLRIEVTSREVGLSSSNTYVSMTVTAFIPPAYIPTGTTINEVGLFSTSTGPTLLSRINLVENKSIISVKAGYGIDIVWNLMISFGADNSSDMINDKTIEIAGKLYYIDDSNLDEIKLIYNKHYIESGGIIYIDEANKYYKVERSGAVLDIKELVEVTLEGEDFVETSRHYVINNLLVTLDNIDYRSTSRGLIRTEEYTVEKNSVNGRYQYTVTIDGKNYNWVMNN